MVFALSLVSLMFDFFHCLKLTKIPQKMVKKGLKLKSQRKYTPFFMNRFNKNIALVHAHNLTA